MAEDLQTASNDPRLHPIFDLEGNVVPEDKLAATVASGQWTMPVGGSLSMVGPDGKRQVVKDTELKQAFAQGYRPESMEAQQKSLQEQQYAGAGYKAAVAAGAALGSVPLVGPELVKGLLSPEEHKDLAAATEVHPGYKVGGELVGIGTQLALTAGLGGAAAAPEAAEGIQLGRGLLQGATAPWRAAVQGPGRLAAGLAERGAGALGVGERGVAVAGRVAQMTGEGAGLGASAQIAEDTLHATPLQGERIAHAMATGALIGGAAELGMSTLGFVGSKALGAVKGSLGPDALEKFADRSAVEALGLRPTDVQKLVRPGEKLDDTMLRLGSLVRRYESTGEVGTAGQKVLGKASKVSEMMEPSEMALKETNLRLDRMKTELDAVARTQAPEVPELAAKKLLDAGDKEIARLREPLTGPDAKKKAAELEEYLLELRTKFTGSTSGVKQPHVLTPAEVSRADAVNVALGDFGKVLESKAPQLGKTLAGKGYAEFSQQLASDVAKARTQVPGLVDLKGLEKEIQTDPRFYGALLEKDPKGFVSALGDFMGAPQAVARADVVHGSRVTFEDLLKTKRMLGDAAYPKPVSGIAPLAPAAHDELVRLERMAADATAEAGETLLTKTGQDPSAWRALNRDVSDWITVSRAAKQRGIQQEFGASYGLRDAIAGHAGAMGGIHALAMGHPVTAATLAATGLVHKTIRERGAAIAASAASAMSVALRGAEARTGMAAKALALGRGVRVAAPLEAAYALAASEGQRKDVSTKDVPGLIADLQNFAALPEKDQTDHIVRSLGGFVDEYPRQTAQAVVAMRAQANFLAQIAPKPTKTLTGEVAVRPSEQEKFDTILRAVADPVSVFEDISKGRINPTAIAAVKTTSPALFRDFRDQVVANIADRDLPPDVFEARTLSTVFGLKYSQDADPDLSRWAQKAMLPPATPKEAKVPNDIKPPKGLQTIGQKLEAKQKA